MSRIVVYYVFESTIITWTSTSVIEWRKWVKWNILLLLERQWASRAFHGKSARRRRELLNFWAGSRPSPVNDIRTCRLPSAGKSRWSRARPGVQTRCDNKSPEIVRGKASRKGERFMVGGGRKMPWPSTGIDSRTYNIILSSVHSARR